MGSCSGDMGCEEIGAFSTLRSRIANRIHGTNCGSGCGEIYWDEHINEPPVCDPCGCDNDFECSGNGGCPTALGRLRNLWGYRYIPSNCGECTSCGTTTSRYSSGSCSTCAGNTHAGNATEVYAAMPPRTMVSEPATEAVTTRSPTPASKPRPQRVPSAAPSAAPTPVPDANAMYRYETTPERLAIGSGVTEPSKRTVARPVTANTKQSIQGKPRLVTNPR